jgi:outer membrane biosynthesis protein TonB
VWLYLIALASTSALAASGDEFYNRLYARGLAQFNEGNYAGAYSSLRLSAFGLLEDVVRFETAEVYMTVAAMRLHQEDEARVAAHRVVAGERVERHYASLALPGAVRADFEDAARRLLSPDQLAILRVNGPTKPPQGQPAKPQPPPKTVDITIPGPVIVPAPQPQTETQTPRPAPVPVSPPQPAKPAPRADTPAPQPQPQTARPQPPPVKPSPDVTLAEADRAVNSGDLATARTLYRSILEAPQLTHATALRAAEGLYRSRDFAGAIRAFERAGPIGAGEEQYHYYYAVALYESGRYGEAKRELRAALPYIEVTPDVERYRVRIEGAIE